jgi:hypothetical protein
MKLDIKAFGLTLGLFWGVAVFTLTWWIIFFDGITYETTMLGRMYRGYNVSPVGSIIGTAWALIDGFVCGVIFAWLYNTMAGRLSQKTGT